MILINDDILIENTMDLNEFVDLLNGQVYDDTSKIVTDCIVDFLYDIWDRDSKVIEMLHKKVSEDLVSMVLVDLHDTADLTKVQVTAVSKNKDYKPTKADDIAFNEFCSRYFKTIKPLYYRITDSLNGNQ